MADGENRAVWAIIRVDGPLPADSKAARDHITVKAIMFDDDGSAAHAEAERLNRLNAVKGCHYFAQYARWSKIKGFIDG